MSKRIIIQLVRNGDPYGRGFTGRESRDGGETWFYRGDAGAQTRAWWRREAGRVDAILREDR